MELHVVDGVKTNFDFLEKYNFEKIKTMNQHELFFNKFSDFYNYALEYLKIT
jgi:hypothetical protein